MCGFTGSWNSTAPGAVEQALNRIAHRGPDDTNIVSKPHFELGHCRLSVISPVANCAQPMWDEDQRHLLVFNGEIYNYRSLRIELRELGHTFLTDGDTEVLLHVLIEWGAAGLKKLNGCFSIAFIDTIRNTLLLARDHAGINPLWYAWEGKTLLFASELKGLALTHRPRINAQALNHFFQYTYCPVADSIYEGVHKLPPGTYLEIPKHSAPQKWFDLAATFNTPPPEDNLRTLLTNSVQDRMVADVPLGSFLSGGIDSSIVAALAAKQVNTLSTFSIGFKDQPLLDETDDAKRVAEFIGSDHHAFKLTEADLVEHTEHFLTHLDEPFADSSSIAVSFLAKQTKKKVTVALSGDGADELFGGYNKHRGHALALNPGNILLPKNILKRLQTSREGKWQNKVRQVQRYLEAAKLSEEERYHYWARFSSLSTVQSILRGPVYQAPYATVSTELNNVLLNDQSLVLPGDMLHKVDLMSMRWALEVRTPFLDQSVIRYANALPTKEKYNSKIGKLPLRSAFNDLLPASVFEKKKHGFEIPLESLLRGQLSIRLKALVETDVFDGRFFNTVAISAYIQSFLEGENKYLSIVWSLFVFSEWEKNERKRFNSTTDYV